MQKVKVFISSTFKDLEHYRTEVDKTIRVLDSESISMEHFGSDHRQPLDVCLAAIEDCDLFVGIYGLRYGFTPPSQSLSITELEYNHAISQGKPILAFIGEDTIQYEKDYVSEAVSTDSAEVLKLKSFKDRIRIERVIREFVTKDELGKYMAIELGKYYIKIIRGQILSNPLTHLPLPNDIYYPTGSPYVGLRCFSRREAKVFYGRNQLIFDLYQKLHQPEPIILVYGQTGVGKSSVLDAGLIPRLEKQNWLIFPLKRLYEQGLPNQLNIILQEVKQSGEYHLLVIDQVEELWTNPNPQLKTEKEDFFKIIYSLLEPYDKNIKIILSFRKEFLAEVRDALTGLPYLEQMVKPMNQPELIEAITQIYQDTDAFKRYHIKVSEELPHEIAYDLRKDEKSHLAPLLQATLSQMWELASKSGFEDEISFDHKLYNQVKTESLEGFLKAQLNKIGESYPESLENGLLLDILNYFTTDLGTSAQHSLTELIERYSHIANLNDLLIAFENKYLLLKNDKQTFKLSHDSLAPLVQKAFRTSDAAGQKAARILGSKDFYQQTVEYFTPSEYETIGLGIMGMRKWLKEELQALQITAAELERKRKKKKSQKRIIKLGIGGILTVSLVLFILTIRLQNQKKLLILQNLISESDNYSSSHGLQLLEYARNSTNDSGIIQLINNKIKYKFNNEVNIAFHEIYRGRFIDDIEFATNSKWVVDKESKPTPTQPEGFTYDVEHFFDYRTGYEQKELSFDNKGVGGKRLFSPDGQYVLLSNCNILDTESLHQLNFTNKHQFEEGKFSENSKFFAFKVRDTLHNTSWKILNIPEKKLLNIPLGLQNIEKIYFPNSSPYIILVDTKSKIVLWNYNLNSLHYIKNWESEIQDIIFAKDDSLALIVGKNDKSDLKASIFFPNEKKFLIQNTDGWDNVKLSPNSKSLIYSTYLKKFKMVDIRTGNVPQFLKGQKEIEDLKISPNNQYVSFKERTGYYKILDIEKKVPLNIFSGTEINEFLDFSMNSRYIIIKNKLENFEIWDIQNGLKLDFIPSNIKITHISFSKDSKLILTKHLNNEYRIWNINNSLLSPLIINKENIDDFEYTERGALILANRKYSFSEFGKQNWTNFKINLEEKLYSQNWSDVTFSPNKKFLINKVAFKRHEIFDLSSGEKKLGFVNYEFKFSPNDKMLLLKNDSTKISKLLNTETWNEFESVRQIINVKDIVFSSDGRFALIKNSNREFRIFDLNTGVVSLCSINGDFSIIQFSRDNDEVLLVNEKSEYCTYSFISRKIKNKILKTKMPNSYINSNLISSDLKWIVYTDNLHPMSTKWSSTQDYEIFNLNNQTKIKINNSFITWNVELSPDGKYLICYNKKGKIEGLLEVKNGKEVNFLDKTKKIDFIKFSNNSKYMTFVINHRLTIWDMNLQKPITNIWFDKKPTNVQYYNNMFLIITFGKSILKIDIEKQKGNYCSFGNELPLNYSDDEVIEWIKTFKNKYLSSLTNEIKKKYNIND